MARVPNIHGGGATTNLNGLRFEQTTDLLAAISANKSFRVKNNTVFKNGEKVAEVFQKHGIYSLLLPRFNIDYRDRISKKLLPDDALLTNNDLFIIEKKFQKVAGSVDEKLQTCDFKKQQYQKLLAGSGLNINYFYVLNDWFKQAQYADTLRYIRSVGCEYFFNEICLDTLGLNQLE